MGRTTCAEILHGARTKKIERNSYDGLPAYGTSSNMRRADILARVDELIEAGVIATTGGPYPVLQVPPRRAPDVAFRVAVLVSGEGTQPPGDPRHRARPRRASRSPAWPPTAPEARGLERARDAGDRDRRVRRRATPTATRATPRWATGSSEHEVDLVVLAGFMELLGGPFIRRFEGRIVNVHPSLLPAFPGVRAIEQALEYGVRVMGVTVHFVDEGVDSGPVLLQESFELPYPRDIEAIEQQVHEIEHRLLPRAVRLIAAGAVSRRPRQPAAGADRWPTAEGAGRSPRRARCACGARCSPCPTSAGWWTSRAAWPTLGVEIVSTGGTARELDGGGHRDALGRGLHGLPGDPRRAGQDAQPAHLRRACWRCGPNAEHVATLDEQEIEPIDLVCVNLYPFERVAGAARARPRRRSSRTSTSAGPR